MKEVKKIVNYKVDDGKRYFEVIWKSSWEEEGFIRSIADELVDEFLKCSYGSLVVNEHVETATDGLLKVCEQVETTPTNATDDIEEEPSCNDVSTESSCDDVHPTGLLTTVAAAAGANNNDVTKPRKGGKGINAVICRLQKNQKEGLLKQFDDDLETDHPPTNQESPHSFTHNAVPSPPSNNNIVLHHNIYPDHERPGKPPMAEYPVAWKSIQEERHVFQRRNSSPYKMNQRDMREMRFDPNGMHPNEYLAQHPLSPREAPREALEGSFPTNSSGVPYFIPIPSEKEAPRYAKHNSVRQRSISPSSLQSLKSNVDNISKLFLENENDADDQPGACESYNEYNSISPQSMKMQQQGVVLKCMICSDVFYEDNKFKQHMYMHEQVRLLKEDPPKMLKPGTFQCKFCQILLDDKDKLKFHYSEKHEKEFVYTQPIDQLYQCTFCDHSFVDYNKLLQHHQSHQQARREVFILPKKHMQGQHYMPGNHVNAENQTGGGLTLVHHHASPQPHEHQLNTPMENRHTMGANQAALSPNENHDQLHLNYSGSGKNDYDDVFEDDHDHDHEKMVQQQESMEAENYQHGNEIVVTPIKEDEEHVVVEYGDKKLYRCNLCDEMFETENDRAKHSLIHVNRSSSLDCHICGKQFRHRTNLSTHLIVHSGVKPHQCHICLRRFTQKVNLQRHMHIHDGSRPFTCRMCSKSFTQKANLQRHILSHTEHTKEELLTALNEIPNESEVNNAINESLTEAMSIVMEQKQTPERDYKPEYRCDMCEKTFAQKVNLQKHMLIHSGTRPFQCYVCGKAFRQRASLQKHYAVHTNGSSSFICQTCSRLFVSRTNLQRHMLVHAVPGKNQCFLCDQKFSTTDNLERHFSEHIEEATPNISLPQKYFEQSTPGQTFRCATCEIVFDSPIIFSQHLQCHQKGFPADTTPNDVGSIGKVYEGNQQFPLQCNICGDVFMSVGKLEAHMAVHADEGIPGPGGLKYATGIMMSTQMSSSSPIEAQTWNSSTTPIIVSVSSGALPQTPQNISQPQVKIEEGVFPSTNGAETPQRLTSSHTPRTPHGSVTPRVSRCPVCKEMFPSKADMREHYSIAHLETPSPTTPVKPIETPPKEPVHTHVETRVQTPTNMETVIPCEEPVTNATNQSESVPENIIQVAVISESEERLIKENEEFIKDNILGGPAEYESKGRYERGNYSCKICNRVLTYKYSLEKHMLLHTGSFPYKCHLCSKRFNHKANYDKHLIVHRGEKPYACHICQRPFSQKSNLQRHQLTHTQNRDFICDVCGKRFNHMASLKTHSLIHTGAKPFSCYICTKRFNQKGNLKRHIQTHRTGKRNKISGLDDNEADIDSLIKSEIQSMVNSDHHGHMDIIKSESSNIMIKTESATMVMPDDEYYTDIKDEMENGMEEIANEDNYYVTTKERKSESVATPSRRSHRKRQKKHKNMEDFEFPLDDDPLPTMIGAANEEFQMETIPPSTNVATIDNSFADGYEGEQILTVLPSDAVYEQQTDVKPFSDIVDTKKETFHCGSCSKLFISLASLEAHKRTAHSFIMCDICGRPFSQKANLLKHKLIHANKKPFGCRVCSKAFRQKANLQRHELIHDKDRKTVNCEECNKSFRCAWSLKQHMKNHNAGGAYGCSICGKTFKGKDRLMHHFSIHNQLGVFTCHLCEMKFPSPEHLLKHLETHGTFPEETIAAFPLPNDENIATSPLESTTANYIEQCLPISGENIVEVSNEQQPMVNDWDKSVGNQPIGVIGEAKTVCDNSIENEPMAAHPVTSEISVVAINNEMVNGSEMPVVVTAEC